MLQYMGSQRVQHNLATEQQQRGGKYIPVCVCMNWHVCMCVLVTQLCLTLYDPVDCSPPGFSVREILQARILEQFAISFSRGSSQPRNRTQDCCIADRFFTIWATGEGIDKIWWASVVFPIASTFLIFIVNKKPTLGNYPV